jgi:hypothetical protein
MSRMTPASEASVVQLRDALVLSRSAYYAALEGAGEAAAAEAPNAFATPPPSLTRPAAEARSVDAATPPTPANRSSTLVSDEAPRSAIIAVSAAQPAWERVHQRRARRLKRRLQQPASAPKGPPSPARRATGRAHRGGPAVRVDGARPRVARRSPGAWVS